MVPATEPELLELNAAISTEPEIPVVALSSKSVLLEPPLPYCTVYDLIPSDTPFAFSGPLLCA